MSTHKMLTLPGTTEERPLPSHAIARWEQVKQQLQAAQQPILQVWNAYIEGTLRSEGVDLEGNDVTVSEPNGTYTVKPKGTTPNGAH